MKRVLSTIAATALVLGTAAPAAFAYSASYTDISGNFAAQDIISLTQQGYIHGYSDGTFRPNSLVTRGQFLAYFMNVAKTATNVTPHSVQQFYRDVPARNWDYMYVGAAQQAGWINPYWIGVKLGGVFNENYQASWGDVASFFVAAMETSGKLKTTNGMAPLAYAKSIGLFNGIPSTQNQIYLNRASAAVVLENILNWITAQAGPQAPSGATVTVTGGSTMAPNTAEDLTVTMKDGSGNVYNYGNSAVTYNVNSTNAFVQNGKLVVLAAGTYQVTATVLGVTSAPLTVTVYGQAAGVKLSAAQPTMIADGQMTDTITATIVDSSGNPVSSFNGTMNFSDSNGQLVGASGTLTNSLTSVQVVNGAATVTLKSTGQPGISDTVTASNVIQSGSTTAIGSSTTSSQNTITVQQVPQQATSLKVTTASSSVEDNVPTEASFSVQVMDQAGYPMVSGTYPISLSVSSNGRFDVNTLTTTAYVGNGSNTAAATGNVWSEQGVSGPIVITATSQGLQTGSATIQAVVVGSPASLHLAVDPTSSGTFAAGSPGGLFDITTTDANGNTVTDPNNPTYLATVWQGSTQITSGVTATMDGNRIIVSGTQAGSYTLKVTSSDNLQPASINFAITSGTAMTAAITAPGQNVDLPISADSTMLQAQLEDTYGNPVATSGVPVQFTVTTISGTVGASLNGSTTSQITVDTGANGAISIPFVGSTTPGDQWSVAVTGVNGQAVSTLPMHVQMVDQVPTQVKVSLQTTNISSGNNSIYLNSNSYAQAGDTVTLSMSATDAFGNGSPNGDELQVTLPAGLTNPTGLTATTTAGVYDVTLPSSGVISFSATAAQAGTAVVQVKDLSVSSANLTGSASMNILPGASVGAALFNTNGQLVNSSNPVSVIANTPVELWLRPVDSEGNAVIESQTTPTFTFSDGGQGGQFRSTATGTSITSIQIPTGSSGVPVYYVNGTSNSYVLSANLG